MSVSMWAHLLKRKSDEGDDDTSDVYSQGDDTEEAEPEGAGGGVGAVLGAQSRNAPPMMEPDELSGNPRAAEIASVRDRVKKATGGAPAPEMSDAAYLAGYHAGNRTPADEDAPAPGGVQSGARGKLQEKLGIGERNPSTLTSQNPLQALLDMDRGATDDTKKAIENYKNTPLSGQGNALAALVDAWTGSNIAGSGPKPESQAERNLQLAKLSGQVGKEQQAVTGEHLKALLGYNKADTDWTKVLATLQGREIANSGKQGKDLDKMEQSLATTLNPMNKKIYSNLGDRLTRANSAYALLQQHPDYNLNTSEMKDLALTAATLLSNQNRVPYELVQGLTPRSFTGDINKAIEYLANGPKNTNQQEFVKRIYNTVDKEREITQNSIKQIQKQQLEGFHGFAVARPDRYQAHVQAAGNYLTMPNLNDIPDPSGADAAPQTGQKTAAPTAANAPKTAPGAAPATLAPAAASVPRNGFRTKKSLEGYMSAHGVDEATARKVYEEKGYGIRE